ncbi:MAG: LytTR family DNA-binding domain-containing protein [Flavobacteriales bacterium]|nr:LytTR family DNA-binding domain-containing protein [Flavobacteriales bacterium]
MEDKIDVLIVDDEPAQREQLETRLQNLFPQLNITGKCSSAEEATLAVARTSPRLVFLDVEMPGMNGFEFLDSLSKIHFDVIFTTSHAGYATRAFRVAAVDFLLKPYPESELQEAVNKFLHKQLSERQPNIEVLLSNLRDKSESKLALPTSNGYIFVKLNDVVRLESHNTYTTFFMKDKNQIVVSRTMKECEEMLSDSGFIRVHQSHMINLSQVKKFVRGEGGTIEMDDGSHVEVSRRKKDEFLEALRRL